MPENCTGPWEGSGRASFATYLASKVPKEHSESLGTESSGECRSTSAFSGSPVTLPAAFADKPAAVSPIGLWPRNWGDPDGRYRNTRSVSRRAVHSGRVCRVLHRPRSRRARGGGPETCASRVARGGRDHNGRRNMVDALRRHARLQHANTDVLRHRIDRPFARGSDLGNWRRLLRHQSP